MALRHRFAARFFSAFFRWSRIVDSTWSCSHNAHLRSTTTLWNSPFGGSRTVHIRKHIGRPTYLQLNVEDTQETTREQGQEKAETHTQKEIEEQTRIETDILARRETESSVANDLRSTMRHVPHPVVLVMAPPPTWRKASREQRIVRGMAVSSFNTVSLNPSLISFNVREPSITLTAIRANNGYFHITILRGRVSSAKMVENFTQGNSTEALKKRADMNIVYYTNQHPKTGVEYPWVPMWDTKDVSATLTCKVHQEVRVGDHVIVVASVLNVKRTEKDKSTLAYVQGKYVAFNGRSLSHVRTAKEGIETSKPLLWHRRNPVDSGYWFLSPFTHDMTAAARAIKNGGETRENYEKMQEKDYRKELSRRVEEYIHQNSDSLFIMQPHDAVTQIRVSLMLPEGALGIDVQRIFHVQRPETSVESRDYFKHYYGRLTPYAVSFIGKHLTELVHNRPKILEEHFRDVYDTLSVELVGTGLFVSDLMKIVRDAGVISGYEPTADLDISLPVISFGSLEQIDNILITHLRTLDAQHAVLMPSDQLLNEAFPDHGEVHNDLNLYVEEIRARLHSEAFPQFFKDSAIDITRVHSKSMARVIYRRILEFFSDAPELTSNLDSSSPDADSSTPSPEASTTHPTDLESRLALPPYEVLRRCRIDPLVQDFDPYFILSFLRTDITGPDSTLVTLDQKKTEMNEAFFRRKDMDIQAFLELFKSHLQAGARLSTFSTADLLAMVGYRSTGNKRGLWVYIPPVSDAEEDTDSDGVRTLTGVWLHEDGDRGGMIAALLELATARSSWRGDLSEEDRALFKLMFEDWDGQGRDDIRVAIDEAKERWSAQPQEDVKGVGHSDSVFRFQYHDENNRGRE